MAVNDGSANDKIVILIAGADSCLVDSCGSMSEQGIDVEEQYAHSVDHVLDRLRNGTVFALVLLELDLGMDSGLEPLRIIRSEFTEIPIVVTTHALDTGKAIEAGRIGANGVIEYSQLRTLTGQCMLQCIIGKAMKVRERRERIKCKQDALISRLEAMRQESRELQAV